MRATTSAVAARAGLTTGALHHHFAGKEDLYAEVHRCLSAEIADEVTPLAMLLDEGPGAIDALVGRLWKVYGGRRYWAVWEINIGGRADPGMGAFTKSARAEFVRLFEQRFLGDRVLPKLQRVAVLDAMDGMFCSLRGLVLESFVGRPQAFFNRQLTLISERLSDQLSSALDSESLGARKTRSPSQRRC
jgi:AcrR family transcriptional regulator